MKGKIQVLSRDVWTYSEKELLGKIGYVFQNAEEQLITFSVFDELAFALENLGISKVKIQDRVTRTSSQLGISHLLNRNVIKLSGGEKQKVVIAANLVMDQEILIFDEPLAFLDLDSQRAFLETLKAIHAQRPTLLIVIVEHRFSPFKDIVDKVLILGNEGNMVFFGDKEQFERSAVGTKIVREMNVYPNLSAFIAAEATSKENAPSTSDASADTATLLEMEHVSFQYTEGTAVLSDFSTSVKRGEFIGIVGPNGSGKTTLLHLIMGILKPNTGDIHFDGMSYDAIPPANLFPHLGFIFQNPETQIFEDTVADEILFGPRNFVKGFAAAEKQEQEKIIDEYLTLIHDERISNKELARKNPFMLSWGQKRRLNLGSVFVYNPDLILLDEPFIGQDVEVSEAIMHYLDDACTNGKAVIIVTHDLDLLRGHCTRYIQLEKISTRSDNDKSNVRENGENTNKGQAFKEKSRQKQAHITKLGAFLKASIYSNDLRERKSGLNPMSKIVSLVGLTLILLLEKSLILLATVYIIVLVTCWLVARESGGLFKHLKWIVLLIIIYVPLNTIFDATVRTGDEILFFLFPPNFPIRRIAVYYSVRMGILMMTLFTSSIAFTRTTTIKDFLYSLMQAGLSYRIAFAFMVGLRYMPIIQDEARTIEIAQKVRGLGMQKRIRFKNVLKMIVHRISTLLISVLRKTRITAMAMDVRAFGASKTRTNMYHVAWRRTDTIWLITCCIIVSVFILHIAGLIPVDVPSILELVSSLFTR